MTELKRAYQLAGPNGMRVTVDMPVESRDLWNDSLWVVTIGEETPQVTSVRAFRDGGTMIFETEAGLVVHSFTHYKDLTLSPYVERQYRY